MFSNIVIYNKAVAAQRGVIKLVRPEKFDENPISYTVGTGAFKSTLNGSRGEVVECEVEAFNDVIIAIGRKISVIKMDIEGCEVEILENALICPILEKFDKMYVETHEAQMPQLRKRIKKIKKKIFY